MPCDHLKYFIWKVQGCLKIDRSNIKESYATDAVHITRWAIALDTSASQKNVPLNGIKQYRE